MSQSVRAMRLSRNLFAVTGRFIAWPPVACRRLSSSVAQPRKGRGPANKWAWAVAGAGTVASIAVAYELYEDCHTPLLHRLLPTAQAQPKVASASHLLTKNFVADAVAIAAPSVVNIASISGTGFMPMGSAGSGFIISKDGYIVTNAHVVPGGRESEVVVTLHDSRKYQGVVHSLDEASDIAIVKIAPEEDLPVAILGSSADLRPGEFVLALGSPLQLQNSVSLGIVSALARHGSELGMMQNRTEYIQTDAAINSGNSGGPLVNMDAEVVGISNMKAQGASGISFAIPIDTANQVISQLLRNKAVVRPYIGMRMVNYVPSSRGGNKNLPPAFQVSDTLVQVVEVEPGSPAEAAGFLSGDIILSIDGRKVSNGIPDVLGGIGIEVGKTLEFKIKRRPGIDQTIRLITAPETSARKRRH